MQPAKINEPIEIIVYFVHGKVKPLRIKWSNKVFKVKEVYSVWTEDKGQDAVTHIGVLVHTGDHMDLAFDNYTCKWKLIRVYLPG